MTVLQTAGLSHSDIRGSKVICTSPRLFAAYHVLHRLLEPRHPTCALSYFLFQRRQAALGINEASFGSALDCTVFLRLALMLSDNVETLSHEDIAHTFSCIEIYQNSTVLSVTTCQRSSLPWLRDMALTGKHVENNGFEPLTPCLQSRCSSQLS